MRIRIFSSFASRLPFRSCRQRRQREWRGSRKTCPAFFGIPRLQTRNPLEKLLENLIRYFESRLGLVRLEVEEAVSVALAKLLRMLLTGVACLLAILFLSWAVAALLNAWIGNAYAGPLIVGGLYSAVLLGLLSRPGQKLLGLKAGRAASRIFEGKKKPSP